MFRKLTDAAQQARRPLAYGRQAIDQDDIDAVVRVLNSDFLTTGPEGRAFEMALAKKTGAAHAITCANGTAALYLAAKTLGLGAGDAVIVPSVTFVATASAPHLAGADIVFADVNPETGLMGAAEFEAAIARLPAHARRRALFNVHLNGQCEDIVAIHQIALQNDLLIVDDACHAIGATYRHPNGELRPIGDGGLADLTVFSFHPVKTIAAGEGGAVTTDNDQLAAELARHRNHAIERDPNILTAPFKTDTDGQSAPWVYEISEPGFNFRMSDLQAALGLSQLSKLDRFVSERRQLANLYDLKFATLDLPLRPITRLHYSLPAWHLYPVLIDFERANLSRTSLMTALKEKGVGTQVHYIPVHRQPYFASRFATPTLSGADDYYQRCLSLPLFVGMDEGDIDYIVDCVHSILS